MEKVILSSESKQNLELILQLAEKLGMSITKLSNENIEDIGMTLAIKEGQTGEYIETDSFLEDLDNAGQN